MKVVVLNARADEQHCFSPDRHGRSLQRAKLQLGQLTPSMAHSKRCARTRYVLDRTTFTAQTLVTLTATAALTVSRRYSHTHYCRSLLLSHPLMSCQSPLLSHSRRCTISHHYCLSVTAALSVTTTLPQPLCTVSRLYSLKDPLTCSHVHRCLLTSTRCTL